MRSLDHARDAWQELTLYHSLDELKKSVRLDGQSSTATTGLRSACWKAFLIFDTLDTAEWQRTLTSSRSAYNMLQSHFLKSIEHPGSEAGFDPLTQDVETSPWTQAQKDQELRAEILLDVDRCMPDNPYFRQKETKRKLLDILFIFCKLNPDIGYRQGMHELAAPILWVVENDAVDIGETSKAMGQDAIIKTVYDADHIEHDAFTIFGQVMQNSKSFYISDGPNSIVTRSRHIFNELLPVVDPELAKHLERLDVLPQVYLIRWIRLLFGREFAFDDVLALWDVIFAEDASLEVVDHICLVMLLRIRWDLLDSDYNGALTLLLHYPQLNKEFSAQNFALDALYLRAHADSDGATYLVLKHTGRPLVPLRRSATPPMLQRNITTFSGVISGRSPGRSSGLSPTRVPRQPRNFEAILQSTAKNIYARGEKLGIGKAVRSAVDEVHKKAQEIRDAQTPSPQPWRRTGPDQMRARVDQLEARNHQLSELLSSAVTELWECQKHLTDGDTTSDKVEQKERIDELSTAIAKVQFVQVYLAEPGLSLPVEEGAKAQTQSNDSESTQISASEDIISSETGLPLPAESEVSGTFPNNAIPGLEDPSTFEDVDNRPPDISVNDQITTPVMGSTESSAIQAHSSETQLPRPSLEHANFSFMLGQESHSPRQSGLLSTEPERPKSFLFGDDKSNSSPSRRAGTSSGANKTETQSEADDFDMSTLRRARGGRK